MSSKGCKRRKLEVIVKTHDSKKDRYYTHKCSSCNTILNKKKADVLLNGNKITPLIITKAKSKLVK